MNNSYTAYIRFNEPYDSGAPPSSCPLGIISSERISGTSISSTSLDVARANKLPFPYMYMRESEGGRRREEEGGRGGRRREGRGGREGREEEEGYT